MTLDNLPLAQLQSWMQHAITTPGDAPPDVNAVVLPSRHLTATERLQIYAHAYHARLFDCLAEEFDTLHSVIGPEAFNDLALGYLQAYPPTSYTLNDLGKNFPSFLKQTRPPRAHSSHETRTEQGWPGSSGASPRNENHENGAGPPDEIDFLIDLATLERTYCEVFDGPGMENTPPLSASQLSALPLEQWLNSRLIPAPCLKFLELQFPAHEFLTARRTNPDTPTPIPSPSPTWLLITRRDYIVRRIAVPKEEFQLLRDLTTGQTIASALEAATQSSPHPDLLLSQIQHWFTTWTTAAYFTALEPQPAP